MTILIAEDDPNTRAGLAEVLQTEGYNTLEAADGDAAVDMFREHRPDFVCVDIMMPGKSGYDVCRAIRGESEAVPIIFISAKSEEIDRVLGLELGADDFIMKPFGTREVVARIRAVSRRYLASRESGGPLTVPFRMADLEVHPAELRARRGETSIDLSLREMKLLECFHANKGIVLDRNTILNVCWGIDYLPNSRTLDQHIAKLRKRIESDPKDPQVIKTVHGVGYRFDG